jgi:hypothetical protein
VRTLTQALETFRHDLGQHLQLDPSVRPIECEAGLAEDDRTVAVTVSVSDGACLCASLDLLPGETFDGDAREFVEDAFALLAAIECGLFAAEGEAH